MAHAEPAVGNGHPPGETIARIAAQGGAMQVPTARLALFIRRDFLPPSLCAQLIEGIDAVRRPSTIADDQGQALYRTSETGDLPGDWTAVREVGQRIAAFTGIDPRFGEPLQGQRYAPGQEFKQHTDYFEPDGADYHQYCAVPGNRTWTVMIYLNQPAAGGATRFKAIDKIIQPESGKLVAWCNRRLDGSLNPASLHAGMKVRQGTKYVITQWFREFPWPAAG